MGCAGWVGSQIRQHGACDGDESQDASGDSSRHPRKQPVQFLPADVAHRDSAYLCVGGQRAQSLKRSLLCAVSQLIPQWMLAFFWSVVELSGFVLDADAACSHFNDGCTAVQAGDVNARRRLSLAVLVCDNDMHGNLELALG